MLDEKQKTKIRKLLKGVLATLEENRSKALMSILDERQRQVFDKGHTLDEDISLERGFLGNFAAAYAMREDTYRKLTELDPEEDAPLVVEGSLSLSACNPDKSQPYVTQLIKAGALIISELECIFTEEDRKRERQERAEKKRVEEQAKKDAEARAEEKKPVGEEGGKE